MFTWSKQPCGHLNGWHEFIKVGWFRKRYFVCTDCRSLINLDVNKKEHETHAKTVNVCPNCKEEMDEKETPEGKMILCGICSYGWYVDLKRNSYKRDKDPFLISMRNIFKEFGIKHKF